MTKSPLTIGILIFDEVEELDFIGQLHSPEVARRLQRGIQYEPAPPYSAEV